MKKILMFVVSAVLSTMFAGNASAIMYEDTFFGGSRDGNRVEVSPCNSRDFNFNLLDNGYNPLTQRITAAALSFTFSDNRDASEEIKAVSGRSDGGVTLFDEKKDLGYTSIGWVFFMPYPQSNTQYWDASYDIASMNMLQYLQDGLFNLTVSAPVHGLFSLHTNDFYVDQVKLSVIAENLAVDPGPGPAPVPEPSTVVLMGAGVVGLLAARKRLVRK